MTNKQAAKILEDLNQWRRSDEIGVPLPHPPKEYGQAIDIAIKALKL